MNLSPIGIQFIKQWEGLRLAPYDDGYGTATIGYGHAIKKGESFGQITPAQAEQILQNDLSYFVNQVNSLVSVPLTQPQFDAAVSLAFNWGGFSQSQFLQLLNAGNYTAAADRLGQWPVTSGGVYSPGLANRRAAEKALFLSDGISPGAPAIEQSPNDSANLDFISQLPNFPANPPSLAIGAILILAFGAFFLLSDD